MSEPLRWAVWRQDDYGTQVRVTSPRLTHAAALTMVEELTARGHKQMYWCAEEPQPQAPAALGSGEEGAP